MAKALIRYEASDKTTWNTEEEADRRDKLILVLDDLTRQYLKPRPDDDKNLHKILNFNGYVQQDQVSVLAYKIALLRIARNVMGGDWKWDEWIADAQKVHPMGFVGRIINDSNCTPLDRAWWRLQCMDGQCREYNQPFFALHPEKSEGGEIE